MTVFAKIIRLIQENRDLLEPFIDFLPIGVYISSPQGEILTVNDYIVKIFEYDSKEEFFSVHKHTNTTFANPETRRLFLEILKSEGNIKDFLVEYKTRNSRIIYASEDAVTVMNAQNEIEYIIGTIKDVTEKIQNEKEKIETSYFISILYESLLYLTENQSNRENLTKVFSTIGKHLNLSSINVFFSNEEQGKLFSQKELVWVNEALKKYVINIPDIKIDFFRIIPRIANIVSSGKVFYATISELDKTEQRIFNKYNIKSVLTIPIMNEGKFHGFIVYLDAFSERTWKDYQIKLLGLLANSVGNNYKHFLNVQEIQSLKTKLETIIDAANIGTWEWDLRNEEVTINSNFANHIGVDNSIAKLNYHEIIKRISQRDLVKFRSAFNLILNNKNELFAFDFKLHNHNKWLNPIGKVTECDANGNPIKLMGILLDITDRKNYEREIRSQNERINTILNASQILLVELNSDGIFTLINGDLLANYGLDYKYINKSINDLEENLSFLKTIFHNTTKGNTIGISIPVGDMIVDCKSQLIRNLEDEVESIFITIVDQTIENRYLADIEKTNQQLYAIINSIPGPVNIVNRNFELMDSNRFLEKGYTIQKPELITELSNFNIFMQFSTICDISSLEQCKSTGMPVQRLTNNLEDDILGFALIIYTQPIYDDKGDIWAYVQIALDVTELKKTQKLLSETIKTKDKFFDIIAHDLRNPINALNMLIDELLKNYSSLSLDEIYDSNIQVQKSVIVLSQLLNNLLEWSRSQTGRLQQNPDMIDTSYVVRNVVEISQDAAKIKNISLINNINYGTVVYCDANMLFTVFRNLVSNSIKYTNVGGRVIIDAVIDEEFIEFVIQDNGVGIPEDRLQKLFNIEFVQSTAGTNREKGSGLGLILCKEFVERNGGSIWVESELNKGTTFKFKLPREPKKLSNTYLNQTSSNIKIPLT